MKIEEQRPASLNQLTGPTATPRAQSETSRVGDAASGDRIELSPSARRFAELRAQVGDPNEIDQERVASLRAALASGAYQPSPDAVAIGLLREVGANSIA